MITYDVYESTGLSPRRMVARNLPTFRAAEAFVRQAFDVLCFEPDRDHPGCADAFAGCGAIVCIEARGD